MAVSDYTGIDCEFSHVPIFSPGRYGIALMRSIAFVENVLAFTYLHGFFIANGSNVTITNSFADNDNFD